jgi:hypothetical protein
MGGKGKRLVYMFKKGFWRALLFTKDGKINKELERCAVRGLRGDAVCEISWPNK